MMSMQDTIKLLRAEFGYTQAQMAAALHLNVLTISRWENGQTTPRASAIAAIRKMADEKGVSRFCQIALDSAV